MKIFKDELTRLWEVTCPKCLGVILNKNGKYRGRQRFICLDCGYSFTTYSKGILNSTKLTEEQWDKILELFVSNKKLKDISEETNVSLISLSKIRRRIYDSLFQISNFDKVLKRQYYNPFDTSTIFIPNKKRSSIYYYKYNDKYVIAVIKYNDTILLSNSFPIQEFNLLMSSVHYPTLDFIPYYEIIEKELTEYIDNLIAFLKTYRGIKGNLLHLYCNFFDYKTNLSPEDLKQLIIKQLPTYRKKTNT